MKHQHRSLAVAALAAGLVACGGESPESPEMGTLKSTLVAAGLRHDVAAVRFDVHDLAESPDAKCGDDPVVSKVSSMEAEALPEWLAGDASQHAFADGLFVLQPGAYLVCATPLRADGEDSEDCAPGAAIFGVNAEETTEDVLYLQCEGDPSGGLDVVAALNDPPHIDDLGIAPSKFIDMCEEAVISLEASDPNGDPLAYEWAILDGPPDAEAEIVGMGAEVLFRTLTIGDYTLEVVVTDGHGGEARLSFPIHVSGPECGAPEAGDVVITELMINPSVAEQRRLEWVEVYVASGPVLLGGTHFENAEGLGFDIDREIVAQTGTYLLFAATADPGVNGGLDQVDYAYGRPLILRNADDEIAITNPDGDLVDVVGWGPGWPRPAGAAIQLDGALDPGAADNADAANWCAATEAYGDRGLLGTPKAANTACE